MNKLPPSVPSGLHPDDIISFDLKQAFINHYLATFKTMSNDEFRKAIEKSKLTPETISRIALTYAELRENGWYPLGVVKTDLGYDIKWAYRVSRPVKTDNLPKIMTANQASDYVNNIKTEF